MHSYELSRQEQHELKGHREALGSGMGAGSVHHSLWQLVTLKLCVWGLLTHLISKIVQVILPSLVSHVSLEVCRCPALPVLGPMPRLHGLSTSLRKAPALRCVYVSSYKASVQVSGGTWPSITVAGGACHRQYWLSLYLGPGPTCCVAHVLRG